MLFKSRTPKMNLFVALNQKHCHLDSLHYLISCRFNFTVTFYWLWSVPRISLSTISNMDRSVEVGEQPIAQNCKCKRNWEALQPSKINLRGQQQLWIWRLKRLWTVDLGLKVVKLDFWDLAPGNLKLLFGDIQAVTLH